MQPLPELEILVRELRPQLVRYLTRVVGDADAEDVVQTVLSKASAARSEYRGEASPRTWLFRIATNAAHDWNRARRTARNLTAEVSVEDAEDDALSPDVSSQERELLRAEMSQCIGEVLARLPESYRTVLGLSDCEELTDKEVAEVLGVTVGSAKIRLHRARAKMKAELESACSFYHDAENNLCCDRKRKSTQVAYPSDGEPRQPIERSLESAEIEPNEDTTMTTETLPTKQKHLIGISAAIAAGCQPCTRSFVEAAKGAGACDRGVRFSLEAGLDGRQAALASMDTFADSSFPKPEVDAAFRAERVLLGALMNVATALASNAASLIKQRILEAKALGATDDQVRLAGQIARTAKRGAEKEAENAFADALGDAPPADTQAGCADKGAAVSSGCGCGCA
ncbi:MAG: sigma-70 family RNA polymerase sigma factor [Polyangiaceae bacterium]